MGGVNNNLVSKEPTTIKVATPANIRNAMANNSMQKQLAAMISDPKRRDSMVSSMVGMVQQTPGLQECELSSVYNAAIAGEALKLPYGFGYWYAVPRANNKVGEKLGIKKGDYKEATFQLGYKGFIQLAMRAGEYKDMDVFEVKEGELKNPNKRTKMLEDFIYLENHDELETIGYFAYFILHNGFTKGFYMTKKSIVKHAVKYSYFKADIYEKLSTGKPVPNAWKYSSFWYTDFDMMAGKTVLKKLISRWGILSVEMMSAIKSDQAVVNEKGEPISYPDNPRNEVVEIIKKDDPQDVSEEEPAVEPDITKLFNKGKKGA